MKTSLYVDGFNFYYGCFRYQRNRCAPADKWIDWRLLAERIAGADSTIHKIHYFIANVHRSSRDPEQNVRQGRYLQAIGSTPGVEIHLGKHIPVTRTGMLLRPRPQEIGLDSHDTVTIRTFEEKGSDVNLAVHLVNDAWSQEIERAIVLSNDTDLIDAIRIARRHIRVDVVSPQDSLAKELRKVAAYSWCFDPVVLRECRMTIPKVTRDGYEVFPPASWMSESWPDADDTDAAILPPS
jgi:uncharacterized LabA/DUF88 family protein